MMAADFVAGLAIINHAAIATGYVGLGAFVARKFDAAGPTMALQVFRLAAALFFVCCALDHADWMLHIALGRPVDMLGPAHMVIDTLQAGGSLVAVILGFSFISLRIYDHSFYDRVLDRAIDEEARRIVREHEAARLDRLTNEVGELKDAAAAIHRALVGDADAK